MTGSFAEKIIRDYSDRKFGELIALDYAGLLDICYQKFGAEQAIKALSEYPTTEPVVVLQSLYFKYRLYEEESKTEDLRNLFKKAGKMIEELGLCLV